MVAATFNATSLQGLQGSSGSSGYGATLNSETLKHRREPASRSIESRDEISRPLNIQNTVWGIQAALNLGMLFLTFPTSIFGLSAIEISPGR